MATIAHSALTGADLHEPKGIATAAANTVYVANGSGSGNYYRIYNTGSECVYDNATGPQSITTSFTDLTNDGAGSLSTGTTYALPSAAASAWDTATNSFRLGATGANLQVGDRVAICALGTITTSMANRQVTIAFDLAHGSASEQEVVVYDNNYKTVGSYGIAVHLPFMVLNADFRDNPVKFKVKSDGTGDTFEVKGFHIATEPRVAVVAA